MPGMDPKFILYMVDAQRANGIKKLNELEHRTKTEEFKQNNNPERIEPQLTKKPSILCGCFSKKNSKLNDKNHTANNLFDTNQLKEQIEKKAEVCPNEKIKLQIDVSKLYSPSLHIPSTSNRH